jgi:hypothetical protein
MCFAGPKPPHLVRGERPSKDAKSNGIALTGLSLAHQFDSPACNIGHGNRARYVGSTLAP